MSTKDDYLKRYENHLIPIAEKIQKKLIEELCSIPRIDRISARAKNPERFIAKASKKENGKQKYLNPLSQIQDQIGARIIVFYLDDVKAIEKEIEGYYRKIEKKDLVPESDSEFGYFGKHYVLKIPDDVISDKYEDSEIPEFFELQIKTLFQHAWSEANHDLGYKPEQELSSYQKRQLAFTAAQSWGADQIFSELHRESSA